MFKWDLATSIIISGYELRQLYNRLRRFPDAATTELLATHLWHGCPLAVATKVRSKDEFLALAHQLSQDGCLLGASHSCILDA